MSLTIDRLASIEHSTVAGYRAGCHGSTVSCGAPVSCADVYIRYQGDWGFRKRLDAGEDAASIFAAELAERDAIRARDKVANRRAKADGAKAAHDREKKQRTTRGPGRAAIDPEVRDAVRRLHAEGKTILETAADLGVSPMTVSRERRSLALAAHSREKVDRATVIRLHADGWSDTRISIELGVSNSTISGIRKRLGLPVNRRAAAVVGPSERSRRARLITDLNAEGKTDGEIAAVLGIKRTAASQARKRLGLPLNPETRRARVQEPRTPRQVIDYTPALTRLHGEGKQDADIATALGLSKNYVATMRRQLGLTANRAAYWRKTEEQLQPHGTNASFARGCRCKDCKDAHREYHRQYTRRRRENGAGENHGTAYGYQLGCRGRGCPATPSCTDAMLDADRERRRAAGRPAAPERVDAEPVREHVRALMAAGMAVLTIAEHADVSRSGLKTLLYGRTGARKGEMPAQIEAEKAQRILALRAAS